MSADYIMNPVNRYWQSEKEFSMEKTYRTKTYGEMPLKLDTGKGWIFPKGVEVKAHVDLETGQVSFFIAPEDLEKMK
jgi:hypothetical protein